MFRFIGRLLWVVIAFVLSAIVAAGLLATLGMERLVQDIQADARLDGSELQGWLMMWDQAALVFGVFSALTLVPAVLLVVVGEVARIRSAIYWVLGGGASLACIPYLTSLLGSGDITLPTQTLLQVLATSGFAGGLAYWALAGRKS